jgi:hypothetical protein
LVAALLVKRGALVADLMVAEDLAAGATHEGFQSYSKEPDVNLPAIRGLVFQAANLSPPSGFSRN